MENNRYRNINELLNEIESLGDWRDVSQRDKFFKVLSKITVIYHGYELEDESGKKSREWYPDEVMQAIVKACKGKFPKKEQAFDKDGYLKPGYPDYSNYLVLVNNASSISLMGERTRIDEIAKNEFGIDVYNTPATKEEVDEMIQSSKEYYEQVINEEKQNAVQIEIYGSTLDDFVESLLQFQKRGKSVVVDFNGHKLYSADISMDGAYKEVLGMTKEEYERKMEERSKEYSAKEARKKAEAEAKIPDWIEKGKAFIYPEKVGEWKDCVKARSGNFGMDLDAALALMEKLESGASMEEVKKMFDEQGHSGVSAGIVRSILLHFAKRGPEFYEITAWRELSSEDKKIIEDKKKENKLLESIHDSKDIKSNLLGAMSMTKSWLSFEDLKMLLSEEQYEELLSTVQGNLEKYYAKFDLENITQEEIQEEIQDRMQRKVFEIGVNDSGNFILQEFTLAKEKLTRQINASEIDASKLASIVEKAMQRHLDYNRFHTNKYLTAEQMPQTLAFYIKVAKECQNRNREISKEESEAIKEALSYSMGADLHEAWRETRKKEDGTYEPRMKKSKDEKWNKEHGTDDVDIANLTFEELPSNWQYENLEAARVAIAQVFDKVIGGGEISEEMIETMSSEVHEAWLKRNNWVYDKEYGNPDQAKPYVDLSEEEKAKDRIQIQEAIQKVQAYVRGEIDINKLNEQYGLGYTKEETPLEEREAKLTELEAEAKRISEAEALIGQHKEGQDIGEE